ncbi:hypothetical protein [Actinophytocola sp.]|uniref:hypothetical protein n=1 Tax=Actinophytocola sp. TaxID=1872138 RepID=UPI002ED5D956
MAPRSMRTFLETALLDYQPQDNPSSRPAGGPPPALPATSPPRGAVLVVPARRRRLPLWVWRTVTVTVVALTLSAAVTLLSMIAIRATAALI